ncbi:MAG TPA: lysozyme [Candidatus Aphodousia faecavium]|nr:lysozyme [Candidatus Aphodousia faecavium]
MKADSFGTFQPAIAADFVAQFEGLRLKTYRCPAGVLTIGYGHTGPDVTEDLEITEQRAKVLLCEDLAKHAQALSRYVNIPINANQFIALLSLAFNVGVHAVASSTLLRLINTGRIQEAADQFLRWNKSGGKVLDGLTRRREAERELFLKDE